MGTYRYVEEGPSAKAVDEETMAFIRENIDSWVIDEQPPGLAPSNSRSQRLHTGNTTITTRPTLSIYDPLTGSDSIRLLRLHGSRSSSDALHCSLEIGRLQDPCLPVFEALSYTWANLDGDATLSARVFVGDEYIPLPVTKNCVSALHQFRTTKDRVLWVDAICINQMDIEERSLQVQIMQSIYSSAARVLVYVGDGTPETDRAMQAIGSARPPEHARSEARQLLSRPYFYRLWVVQEVKAAMRTTITCGDYTTTWDDLLTFADHINKEDGGLLEWVTGNFSSLLTGLRITRYCLCSDPRDKVFAISGLLSPTRNEIRLIQVNYAISVQDLFTSLAISWIMTKQFEFLLNLTRFKQVVHLPSWVPDWTVTTLGDEREVDTNVLNIRLNMFTTFPIESLLNNEIPRFLYGRTHPAIAWNIPAWNPQIRYLHGVSPTIVDHRGALVVNAVRIFHARNSRLELGGFRDNICELSFTWFDATATRFSKEHILPDLECFLIPSMHVTALLKRHAERVYSIYQLCSIDGVAPTTWERQTRDADFWPKPAIFDFHPNDERDIEQFTFQIVGWVATLEYLAARARSPLPTVRNLGASLGPGPGYEDHFRAMQHVRDRILGYLNAGDMALLDADHLRSMFPTPKPQSWENLQFASLVSHLFSEDTKDTDAKWSKYDLPMNELLEKWCSHLDQVDEKLSSFRPIVDQLVDLSNGGRQDCFLPHSRYPYISSRYGCQPLFLVPLSTIQYLRHPSYLFTKDSGERSQTPSSKSMLLTGSQLLYRAWELITKLELDPEKSLDRNRDQIWMMMATFLMVARLHDPLQHRRILMRMYAARMNPEEIIIV